MRSPIVYLLGTDGAGKTSIAKRLAEEQFDGVRLRYVYSQHQSILLQPFRFIARATVMRGTDEFKSFDRYDQKKRHFAGRYRLLTALHGLVWYLDYTIQTWIRLLFPRPGKNTALVMDRYYLDIIVNQACLRGLSEDQLRREARLLEKIFPKADLHIFLDVQEEIAFSRKDDIPSLRYLTERRTKYALIANEHGAHRIDAGRPFDVVYRDVKSIVTEFLRKQSS